MITSSSQKGGKSSALIKSSVEITILDPGVRKLRVHDFTRQRVEILISNKVLLKVTSILNRVTSILSVVENKSNLYEISPINIFILFLIVDF